MEHLVPPLNKDERKKLGEKFVQALNEFGIFNIKDIPEGVHHTPKEHKEIWIVK